MKSKNRSGWFARSIFVSMSAISLLIFRRRKDNDMAESEYEDELVQSQEYLTEQEFGDSPEEDYGDGSDSAPTCSECEQPMVFALRERRWICDSCEDDGSEEVGLYTNYESEGDTEDTDEYIDESDYDESEEIIQFSFMSAEGKGKSSVLTNMKTWDLIFTDRRLICARLVDSGSAVSWFGVVGYGVSKMLEKEKREELVQRNLDHVLGSDKQNFEIPYEMISGVELKRGIFNGKLRIIDSYGNAFKFLIKNKDFDPGAMNLGLILGDRFELK